MALQFSIYYCVFLSFFLAFLLRQQFVLLRAIENKRVVERTGRFKTSAAIFIDLPRFEKT